MPVQSIKKQNVVLVVDLDGTLIRTDLLFECTIQFIKQNPFKIFLLILWLFRGISVLKEKLAEQVSINVKNLPYNEELLNFLKSQFVAERKIVLATASHYKLAKQVAEYLAIFSNVFATTNETNLKGKKKLKILIEEFGEKGFDYIGDSKSDLEIFPYARKSTSVCKKHSQSKIPLDLENLEVAFEKKSKFPATFFRSIRIHQWLKNTLLFVPIITSHNWFHIQLIFDCLLGFLAIGFCASSTYLLNDLLDLQADRAHPRKKNRPFAAGEVSIPTGISWMIALLTTGLIIAYLINLPFFIAILFYMVITLSYSLILKTFFLLDVLFLAILYTIRIIAGALLINVHLSFWLFSFSIFLFFSLALLKRCTELQTLDKIGKKRTAGRDYFFKDLETIRSMGISSGFLSIVVFLLYINSSDVIKIYSNSQILWLVCPMLFYWIGRLWIKTGREEMNYDTIVYTLKDRASMFLLLLIICLVVIATYI